MLDKLNTLIAFGVFDGQKQVGSVVERFDSASPTAIRCVGAT
ncbi:MAG: hypothetical protein AAFY46_05185 [Planctomycetota bacterium]